MQICERRKIDKALFTACTSVLVWICIGFLVASEARDASHPLWIIVERTRPAYEDVPGQMREMYELAMEAERERDNFRGLEIYSRLIDDGGAADDDLFTYFLAQKAMIEESLNLYPDAMETMKTLTWLLPEDNENRFLADLEMARAMADSGGHPAIADFDPTIEEKERQFDLLFSSYTPYREEIIEAHLKFAHECNELPPGNPLAIHYAEVAVNHLLVARQIIHEIDLRPELAHDESTLNSSKRLSGKVERIRTSCEERLRLLRETDVLGYSAPALGLVGDPHSLIDDPEHSVWPAARDEIMRPKTATGKSTNTSTSDLSTSDNDSSVSAKWLLGGLSAGFAIALLLLLRKIRGILSVRGSGGR